MFALPDRPDPLMRIALCREPSPSPGRESGAGDFAGQVSAASVVGSVGELQDGVAGWW